MLDIRELTIGFQTGDPVVREVSFSIREGEMIGIVGESGSGKSMTAYAIMDLLPEQARLLSGSISREALQVQDIAMVYQEPMHALDPVMRIGKQIEEAVWLHCKEGASALSKHRVKELALECMEHAGLYHCESLYFFYPHQLSGGMRQRVLIAMALACRPRLIIADEPTTALDPAMRIRIIERFRKINQKFGTAILLISHDIDVVSSICDQVIVMKDGKLLEHNTLQEILQHPQHPYTKELLAAAAAKLHRNQEQSFQEEPSNEAGRRQGSSLQIEHVSSFYYDKRRVKILEDVSFAVRPGEFFGLVGESGSGKSTLAKAIAGLVKDTEGSILLDGMKINGLSSGKRKAVAEKLQIVFQDPFGSLNPKMKVGRFIEEPLRIHKKYKSRQERKASVLEMLSLVGLSAEYYERYPHELSGGQRQRISIAAALILNPGFVILDEPVSALDLTVEAQIIDLLRKIQETLHITFLFISHDMQLVKGLCHRVAVIRDGKIISIGEPDQVIECRGISGSER